MPTSTSQSDSVRYSFDVPQLPADTFDVVRFQGQEGLSELFAFELELVAENPDIDLLVDEPATFTLLREGRAVPINGIITDFAQDGRTSRWVGYRVTLRPRLWRLTLSFQSRIFQEMTVEDILREVLQEGGLASNDMRFALQEKYDPMEYCVQYQETDFAFISRIMEREGIYYFFEQQDGRDVVVITDHRGAHESMSDSAELYFHEGAGMARREAETVHRFTCRAQMTTQKAQVRDYNYETPETVTSEAGDGTAPARYEYGDGFGDTKTAGRLARVRAEEMEAQRLVMRGQGNSVGMRSGYQFSLAEHFRASLNADYLITRVEHQGSQQSALNYELGDPDEAAAELDYHNAFT